MNEPVTRLGQWMASNEKTDEAVATALKITRSQVNRLRNGTSRPSWETAAALERLTGIPALDLFGRVDTSKSGHGAAA